MADCVPEMYCGMYVWLSCIISFGHSMPRDKQPSKIKLFHATTLSFLLKGKDLFHSFSKAEVPRLLYIMVCSLWQCQTTAIKILSGYITQYKLLTTFSTHRMHKVPGLVFSDYIMWRKALSEVILKGSERLNTFIKASKLLQKMTWNIALGCIQTNNQCVIIAMLLEDHIKWMKPNESNQVLWSSIQATTFSWIWMFAWLKSSQLEWKKCQW